MYVLGVNILGLLFWLKLYANRRIVWHFHKYWSQTCCLFVGEEWPGFDVPPVGSESLWDNEYNPMSAKWPAGPDTPASLQVSYLYSV